MGLSHEEFKQAVDMTLPHLTAQESMALRAVAWHETKYGGGWTFSEAAKASRNLGAITRQPIGFNADGSAICGPNAFAHGDSRRDEKTGQIVKYQTCFASYPTLEDALRDLEKVMLKPNVREAAATGSLQAVADRMRANKYYLGTATTRAGQVAAYRKALESAVKTIAGGTGEPNPLAAPAPAAYSPSLPSVGQPPLSSGARSAPLPTLAVGSRGEAVELWQLVCNNSEPRSEAARLKVDGIFGPLTRGRTLELTAGDTVTGVDWRQWLLEPIKSAGLDDEWQTEPTVPPPARPPEDPTDLEPLEPE